jgi:hypothetical protein
MMQSPVSRIQKDGVSRSLETRNEYYINKLYYNLLEILFEVANFMKEWSGQLAGQVETIYMVETACNK